MKKRRARRQPKRSKPLREEDKPAGPYRYFGGGVALPESVRGISPEPNEPCWRQYAPTRAASAACAG